MARRAAGLPVLTALLVGCAFAAPGFAAETCSRVALSRPLHWATSGVWFESASGVSVVLVADTLRNDVRAVTLDGDVSLRLAGDLPRVEGAPYRAGRIAEAREAADRFFLEDAAHNSILELDPALRLVGEPTSILARDPSGQRRLEVAWDWTPVAEGFLGFGDLHAEKGPSDEGGWVSAFVYFDRGGLRQVLHSVPTDADARELYVNNRHLATLGETGYYLTLEEEPRLHAFRPDAGVATDLAPLPAEFRSWPAPSQDDGWRKAKNLGPRRNTAFWKLAERSTMPVGLYAVEDPATGAGALYLLARQPAAGTSTTWWLVQLDPASGAERARVRLPTAAAHLIVAPGRTAWAFIEKGPVEGFGQHQAPYMETRSMLVVPGGWISDLGTSPLRSASAAECAGLETRAIAGR
jgi:hypothetical protein